MKKKVISGKKAGLSLLVAAMIFIELVMAGCGKKEAVKVADDIPTIEAPTDAQNLEDTAKTAEEVAKAETELQEEKVFDENAIELAAAEYYSRLISNKSEKYMVNETPENVLEMTRRLGGDFSSLIAILGDLAVTDENESEEEKANKKEARATYEENYFREIQNFLNSSTTAIVNAAVDIAVYGKEATIVLPLNYKLLEATEVGEREGLENIRLIETMTEELVGLLGADHPWSEFEPKAKALQSLIESIYLDSANVWNGNSITSFDGTDAIAQTVLQSNALIALGIITAKEAQETLSTMKQTTITVDGSSYSTDELIKAITNIDCDEENNFGYDFTNGSKALFELYLAANTKGKEIIKQYYLSNY